jgi:fatty acid desaturase
MRTTPAATELLDSSQLAFVRTRSNVWGIYLVVHAWVTIVGAAFIFVSIPNLASLVFAVMVIGSRQLGLLILMHDGAHGALCRNRRLNDALSQWFCGFPTLADTFVYRRYHLGHHARTQQDDDPDIVLTGHYPITRASLKRKLWRDLTGRTGFSQRRAQFAAALGSRKAPVRERVAIFKRNLGRQILVNAVLFALCALSGYWYVYPLLWVLPLLTWQQLVLRIRNIAEHAAVADRNNPFRNARTTVANPLERLLVAPYWVNYHVEHHLVMWVPCYRLPKLRQFLLHNGYGESILAARGYLQVLREVTVDAADDAQAPVKQRTVGTFSDGFD